MVFFKENRLAPAYFRLSDLMLDVQVSKSYSCWGIAKDGIVGWLGFAWP